MYGAMRENLSDTNQHANVPGHERLDRYTFIVLVANTMDGWDEPVGSVKKCALSPSISPLSIPNVTRRSLRFG